MSDGPSSARRLYNWISRVCSHCCHQHPEPCTPIVEGYIPEEDVHWPIQETQPDIRTRPPGEQQIATSTIHLEDPTNNMEDLNFSVEELDTSMINLNQHRNTAMSAPGYFVTYPQSFSTTTSNRAHLHTRPSPEPGWPEPGHESLLSPQCSVCGQGRRGGSEEFEPNSLFIVCRCTYSIYLLGSDDSK